jgi:protocatechuate 3,4-dioxygenase beta subunit
MYVAGEPGNARDGILNAIRDAAQRASVIVRLEPTGEPPTGAMAPGALLGTFDIVLDI